MKFIRFILGILIIMLLFVSATPFSIMCHKCWEKDRIRSIANRSISDETSGDTRAVYRCQYGHIIYVDNKSVQ